MATIIEKKVSLNHNEIIKFQLLTECFINKIYLTKAELKCLTLLGMYGQYDLANFCKAVVAEDIFGNPQTVRNFLNKATQRKLIIKTIVKDSNRKKIELNPKFKIQTKGTIVLDFKLFYVTKE